MIWDNVVGELVEKFIGPLRQAWWRFAAWRRSRNPELVELDAFRELVRNGERASASHFQRKLGIGYMQATQIWALLDERGLIETGGGR